MTRLSVNIYVAIALALGFFIYMKYIDIKHKKKYEKQTADVEIMEERLKEQGIASYYSSLKTDELVTQLEDVLINAHKDNDESAEGWARVGFIEKEMDKRNIDIQPYLDKVQSSHIKQNE